VRAAHGHAPIDPPKALAINRTPCGSGQLQHKSLDIEDHKLGLHRENQSKLDSIVVFQFGRRTPDFRGAEFV
jgi:hypothetical protein